MKIVHGLQNLRPSGRGSVATIGVFDGVHIGHARVIAKVVARAKRLGLKSVVMTFDPHPAKVAGKTLRRRKAAPSIISLAHRMRLIEALSPDILVVLGFTKKFASLSAEDFARHVLVDKARAREVYVGSNFYFGAGASSGIAELKALGRRYGFKVGAVSVVLAGKRPASSSAVRQLIAKGDLKRAQRLLGRPVSIFGTVIKGANLARELGYPTANLNPHHEVVPPSGVYAVLVRYGHRTFKGILNIGVRPTFYAPRDQEPAIEVHIFGFKEQIYGKDLEVFFIKKIRQERRFDSQDALVEQIKNDENIALSMLKSIEGIKFKNSLT